MTEQRDRRTYLGSSDCAAILGMDPKRGASDVVLSKLGFTPEVADSPVMVRGRTLEDFCLDHYEETQGVRLVRAKDIGTLTHPRIPYIAGNLDALIADADGSWSLPLVNGIVDGKTFAARMSALYGEEGTDELPPKHIAQAQHYMAITGAPFVDFDCLGGWAFVFGIYRVDRNDAFIDLWEREAARVWGFVERGEVPPARSPDSIRARAKALYGTVRGPLLKTDSQVVRDRLEALRAAQIERQGAEAREDVADALVREMIGDAEGIQTPDYTVTYRANAKGTRVLRPNWERGYAHDRSQA